MIVFFNSMIPLLFFVYVIFKYIYKILVQNLWRKHGQIASIVIWLSSAKNHLAQSAKRHLQDVLKMPYQDKDAQKMS